MTHDEVIELVNLRSEVRRLELEVARLNGMVEALKPKSVKPQRPPSTNVGVKPEWPFSPWVLSDLDHVDNLTKVIRPVKR